jgi:capsular polysaccharide biosynthesis protein
MGENNSLTLKYLIGLIVSNIKLILAITLLCGIVTFCYTQFFVTPLYSARVTIFVNNMKSDDSLDRTNTSDIEASKRLVDTYTTIIKSDTVLTKVAEAASVEGQTYTADQIRSMLSANSVSDTEIFEVSITNPDPYAAARIANVIAGVAPDEISNFVEASSVKIIDYAKVNLTPISPNVQRNTAIALVLGCAAGILIVLLKELFDVRVKSQEDLERLLGLPVLGVIPEIEPLRQTQEDKHGAEKARRDLDGKQPAEKCS